MKIAPFLLATIATASALLLGACTRPDYSDSTCAGFLGCSAGKQVGPITNDENTTAKSDAGATFDINAVIKGMGCGMTPPTDQVATVVGSPKGYTHFTVMGTGANLTDTPLTTKAGPRTFWVRLPADYDPNTAYPLIFVGQGCGGYESANTSTWPLYKEALGGNEEAIYVAIDIPRDMANQDCYDNKDGLTSQEWEAFQLFTQFVDSKYCIDTNRIYVTGYSTGGWLQNMWGCYFGGVPDPMHPRKFAPTYHVRAQAGVTGGEPAVQPPCSGPVAALWIHDINDNANGIQGSKDALVRVGKMNNCDTTYDKATVQAPWHDEVTAIGAGICKQFTTCPKDYPVVFCTTAGLGHASQDSRAVPAFKLFFDMLAPKPAP